MLQCKAAVCRLACDLVSLPELLMRQSEGKSLLANRDRLKHAGILQLLIHHLAAVLQRCLVRIGLDASNVVRLGRIERRHQLTQLTSELGAQRNLLRQSAATARVSRLLRREEGSEELESTVLQQLVCVVVELILILLEESSRVVRHCTCVVLDDKIVGGCAVRREVCICAMCVDELVHPCLVRPLGHAQLLVDRRKNAQRAILDQIQHRLIVAGGKRKARDEEAKGERQKQRRHSAQRLFCHQRLSHLVGLTCS